MSWAVIRAKGTHARSTRQSSLQFAENGILYLLFGEGLVEGPSSVCIEDPFHVRPFALASLPPCPSGLLHAFSVRRSPMKPQGLFAYSFCQSKVSLSDWLSVTIAAFAVQDSFSRLFCIFLDFIDEFLRCDLMLLAIAAPSSTGTALPISVEIFLMLKGSPGAKNR